MPRVDAGRKRCAIYTRKSSEEGLEQEFNSLQAQREACYEGMHKAIIESGLWEAVQRSLAVSWFRPSYSICSSFPYLLWPRPKWWPISVFLLSV